MSYGTHLLNNAPAQTVFQQQAIQLAALNDQLALQRLAQQQQAQLAQLLFETEQAAHKFTSIAAVDPFAAGVMSRVRLGFVAWVQPGLFFSVEHKRQWAGATGQLANLWQGIERDPQRGQLAVAVVQAVETLQRMRAFVGVDHQAELGKFRADAERARGGVKVGQIVMLVFGVASVVLLFVAWPLAFLTGIGAAFGFGEMQSKTKKAATATRAGDEYQAGVAAFNAFMADPNGGRLLEQMAAQHPQLAA